MARSGHTGTGGLRSKEKRGKDVFSRSTANLRALESVSVPALFSANIARSAADTERETDRATQSVDEGTEHSNVESPINKGGAHEQEDVEVDWAAPHADKARSIIDNMVEELAICKPAKRSQLLAKFWNFLTAHEAYRLIIRDQLDWRLETALISLTQIISRSRGTKAGQALYEGISAAKTTLSLVETASESLLANVAESVYDALAAVCLTIVQESKKSSTRQKSEASSPELKSLLLHLLGELGRQHLLGLTALEPLGMSSWVDWWKAQWNRFLRDKESILAENIPYSERKVNPSQAWMKQSQILWHIFDRNEDEIAAVDEERRDLDSMWNASEIWQLDGLSLGTASFALSMPTEYLCHPQNFSRQSTAFIWEAIARLTSIFAESNVDFFNAYTTTLPDHLIQSETSALLLGVPHLVGIAYEALWEGTDESLGPEETLQRLSELWWTKALHTVLELWARISNWSSEKKAVNRNISKAFLGLMKRLSATVSSGVPPDAEPVTTSIRDITSVEMQLEGSAPKKPGEMTSFQVNTWRDLFVLRTYRSYCGTSNGSVAFICNYTGSWDLNETQALGQSRKRYAGHDKMRSQIRRKQRDQKEAMIRSS